MMLPDRWRSCPPAERVRTSKQKTETGKLHTNVCSVYLMSWPVLTGDCLDGGGHPNTAGFTKQEGLQYHISWGQSEFDIKSHKGRLCPGEDPVLRVSLD